MAESFAFAGSGSVDAGNAAALLNDLLPEDPEPGVPGVGAVYRPVRVPRTSTGLNTVVTWLEGELGKRGVIASDDLVASLLKSRKEGDNVSLVMVWPDEPDDEEKNLVLAARAEGIRVLSLGDAVDDLLWEPEPEPEPESAPATSGPTAAEVAAAETALPVLEQLGADLARALTEIIRAVVRDELEKRSPATATAKTASNADVEKIAAKLSVPRMPSKPAAKAETVEELPFDGPHKPASTVFKSAPGADGDDRIKYWVNEDGKYRKAGSQRRRRGETEAYLTPAEVDELVRNGLVVDNK